MADELVGPYQIPQIAADDTVARVAHSRRLAAAISAGLDTVAGEVTEGVATIQDQVDGFGSPWAKLSILPTGTDLNTFNVPGIHRASTPDVPTMLNLPPGVKGAFILENLATGQPGDNSWWIQRVTEYGESPRFFRRESSNTQKVIDSAWHQVGEQARVVTEWHVFPLGGQSNMRGAAALTDTQYGRFVNNRIAEYGFSSRTLRTATVPLDMPGTANGMSPGTVFAHNYLRTQPPHVGVLLVPAARGATGFTNSTTTYTWTPNVATDPAYDLPALLVQQTLEAIAAAKATGAIVDLKALLWHQGENNNSLSTAGYAALLDSLISYFRTELGAANLPFVVGQMVPEGIAANAGRERIDLAHQQTPGRVLYTAFAPATVGGYNPGDTTHMSKAGVEYIGRTYLEAYGRALSNNGASGSGGTAPSNVPVLGADGKIPVAYFPDTIKPTTSGTAPVGKGELFKNVLDYASATAAHAANAAVLYPNGAAGGGANNPYNSDTVKTALGALLQAGTPSAPSTDIRPVFWVQKESAAMYSSGWEQGAILGSTIKRSGDAYASGITGYVATYGGTGDTAGVHGRARIAADGAKGFGGWFYTHISTATPGRGVGTEINVRNDGAALEWAPTSQEGAITLLNLSTSDGTYGVHHGIRFPQKASTDLQRAWTGLQFDNNSIMPSDVNGNGEAIRVRGANYTGGRYGGMTLGDNIGTHMFTYGVKTLFADINNNKAMWLARNHKILFGPEEGAGTSTYLSITDDGAATPLRQLNIQNVNVALNGTQVLRGRKTGWGTATGTAERTAYSSFLAPTYAAQPTTAEVQSLANQIQILSRHFVALIQDLHGSTSGHGLIGA